MLILRSYKTDIMYKMATKYFSLKVIKMMTLR